MNRRNVEPGDLWYYDEGGHMTCIVFVVMDGWCLVVDADRGWSFKDFGRSSVWNPSSNARLASPSWEVIRCPIR